MSQPLPRPVSLLGLILLIPLFGFAAWWSVRLAQADLLQTRPDLASVKRAIAITPSNAFTHRIAATLLSLADPFTNADEAELKSAISLNPRDSAAWMARGMKAEMEGDPIHAEQDLLEASRVNHGFKPAWSLANFYARTDQPEKFWRWLKICLDMVEPRNKELGTFDPQPIFDLCWRMSDDPATIERLAIPQKPFILQRYILFLAGTGRYDAAIRAASTLAPTATPTELFSYYSLINLLLQQNRVTDALTLWNKLIDRHLLPYQQHLDPAAGSSLTNGDFFFETLSQGFDWFFPRSPSVYRTYSHTTRTVRFEFDGDQAEHLDLAYQQIALLPGRQYRLRVKYQTPEIAGTPGFHWQLIDMRQRREAVALPLFPAREEEGSLTQEFSTPASTGDACRLSLRYDRPSGTARAKGSLKLFEVTLELRP